MPKVAINLYEDEKKRLMEEAKLLGMTQAETGAKAVRMWLRARRNARSFVKEETK